MDDSVGNRHVSGVIVTDGRIAMGAMGDQRCANNTLGHDLLQKTIAGVVATHETDLNQTLAASGFGIEDALAGGRSGSQWFFAEHWLVGCDRRQNVFFVGRTDGGHDDGIHTLCCDDVLPSALGPAAKVLGNLLGSSESISVTATTRAPDNAWVIRRI